MVRDPSPIAAEFSAEACNFLTTHPAPFRRFSEPFLCLVGLSRYYELDDNMYPTFLTDAGEEIDLFAFILHAGLIPRGVCIPLVGEDDHDGQNDNIKNLNEGSGDADQENHSEEGDRAGQDEAVTIVVDYEFRVAVANKPKSKKKRRPDGVGGSNNPLKKLREDHGISGDAGVSTGGKYLAAVQDLFERSTLNVEVDVVAAATVPFVTSSMTPTPKHSSHHSSTNAADVEFTSLVRSFVSPPLMMTAAVTTTNVAGTSSAPVIGAGAKPVSQVRQSLFTDSASIGATGSDIAGPSHLAGHSMIDQLAPPRFFSQLRGMDYDQLFAEFNVGTAHQMCLTAKVRQADLLKEKDAQIANLKAQLSLKEAEVRRAILFSPQVFIVMEDAKAPKPSGVIVEGTCSSLRDQVSGYELFKEQCDAVQVKVLSDRVAELDSELMGMVVHLDEEFYPRLLSTIAGRRWVIGHGLRLEVMKCLQSAEYATALGDKHSTITTTTTLSVLATLANVISVLPVYVADYGVQDAGPHNEAPLSPKIVFEKEDLETIPEHPSTTGDTGLPLLLFRRGVVLPCCQPSLVFSPGHLPWIENFLKLFVSVFTFSKYWIMPGSLAIPAIRASYSASLLVASQTKFSRSVHGSGSSSPTSIGTAKESSFGRSTMKSAKICPLIDILGLYFMSYSPSSMLYLCASFPATLVLTTHMIDWFGAYRTFLKNCVVTSLLRLMLGIDLGLANFAFSACADRSYYAFRDGRLKRSLPPVYPDILVSLWCLPCIPGTCLLPPRRCIS
ncbi:hypothetical protein Tco_0832695 [Tanacetum coccineum]